MLRFRPPLQRQKGATLDGRAISFLLSNFMLWVDLKRGASIPERRISAKHISVYSHHKAFLFFLPSNPLSAPNSSSARLTLAVCLTPGAGTGDMFSASFYVSLAVSLTALVALVVLLVNCVTCCKDREIDFKVRGRDYLHN